MKSLFTYSRLFPLLPRSLLQQTRTAPATGAVAQHSGRPHLVGLNGGHYGLDHHCLSDRCRGGRYVAATRRLQRLQRHPPPQNNLTELGFSSALFGM